MKASESATNRNLSCALLQDASGAYFGLIPLVRMNNLRDLRLSQINGTPPVELSNILTRLKQLVTLALPGCVAAPPPPLPSSPLLLFQRCPKRLGPIR